MNSLSLTITVPSLSLLTPIGTNTYGLVIKLYDSLGDLLVSPYVDDTNPVTVTTVVTTFIVHVPIVDDTYTISGVQIKAFANNAEDCCFAEEDYTINNTASEPPAEETLLISGYFG